MIHSCEGMYTGFHLPQFQPSTMCYVETVYHLVRVSGRTIFDLDARLGRSTVSTCGIGEGRDPGEMKASVHVVTTVCHVRGVGRTRRPCIAVCLRNPLNSRPCLQPALMHYLFHVEVGHSATHTHLLRNRVSISCVVLHIACCHPQLCMK
jgi:hypothetical protein